MPLQQVEFVVRVLPDRAPFEQTRDRRYPVSDIAVRRSVILDGEIVALKGLGGYHLACSATNDRAVTELIEGNLRCERFVDPRPLREWYRSPASETAGSEAYGSLFRVLSLEMWMRAFDVH